MRKVFKTITVFSILGLFMSLGIAPAMAQDGGFELPDIDTSVPASEDDVTIDEDGNVITDSDDQNSEQLPNQAFITGLAAGAAVGVIVGGVVVWFTKKN